VFCSRWLAETLISFEPKFVVTAFEGLVHIPQGTRNCILSKNFYLKNYQDFVFKYRNEHSSSTKAGNLLKAVVISMSTRKIQREETRNVFNPSAWGHLNPSSYCDVGRLFYGVFKLWYKLQRKK